MTLKERLDAATTVEPPAQSTWNLWPDQLEVVRVTPYDQTSPSAMYDLGYLMGRATEYRQIRYTQFSYENAGYDNEDKPLVKVRQLLPQPAYGQGYTKTSLVYVHFGLAAPRGQEDDGNKRNILAIFPPQTRYDHIFQRQIPVTHGLVVEIGCNHDYSDAGSDHRRGYHKGRCARCGHTWMCDSGD